MSEIPKDLYEKARSAIRDVENADKDKMGLLDFFFGGLVCHKSLHLSLSHFGETRCN